MSRLDIFETESEKKSKVSSKKKNLTFGTANSSFGYFWSGI